MACSSCNPELMSGLKPSAASGASFWANLTRLRPGAVSPQGPRGGPGPTSTCPGGEAAAARLLQRAAGFAKSTAFTPSALNLFSILRLRGRKDGFQPRGKEKPSPISRGGEEGSPRSSAAGRGAAESGRRGRPGPPAAPPGEARRGEARRGGREAAAVSCRGGEEGGGGGGRGAAGRSGRHQAECGKERASPGHAAARPAGEEVTGAAAPLQPPGAGGGRAGRPPG